jgi:hypothetical protein
MNMDNGYRNGPDMGTDTRQRVLNISKPGPFSKIQMSDISENFNLTSNLLSDFNLFNPILDALISDSVQYCSLPISD